MTTYAPSTDPYSSSPPGGGKGQGGVPPSPPPEPAPPQGGKGQGGQGIPPRPPDPDPNMSYTTGSSGPGGTNPAENSRLWDSMYGPGGSNPQPQGGKNQGIGPPPSVGGAPPPGPGPGGLDEFGMPTAAQWANPQVNPPQGGGKGQGGLGAPPPVSPMTSNQNAWDAASGVVQPPAAPMPVAPNPGAAPPYGTGGEAGGYPVGGGKNQAAVHLGQSPSAIAD